MPATFLGQEEKVYLGYDGINLFAWVRNAFDEDCFEQPFVGPGNTGLIAGLPGDPRTWGATAAITF